MLFVLQKEQFMLLCAHFVLMRDIYGASTANIVSFVQLKVVVTIEIIIQKIEVQFH